MEKVEKKGGLGVSILSAARAVAQRAYSYAYLVVQASDQMTMWVFMVRQRLDAQVLEPCNTRTVIVSG